MFFGFSALSVEGHSGFDALIQFSPFHFIVEISTSFSVKVFGVGVWGLGIDLTLEGPTPWHAHGTASISLLFFSIGVDFDVTWGDDRGHRRCRRSRCCRSCPASSASARNWQAVPPSGANLLVSLRQLDPGDADLVLHPVGSLQVSQRARAARPDARPASAARSRATRNRCALSVTSGRSGQGRATCRSRSRPRSSRTPTTPTKLSEPAFSPQDSGIELAPAGQAMRTGTAADPDRPLRPHHRRHHACSRPSGSGSSRYPSELFTHCLGGAAVARNAARPRRRRRCAVRTT